MDSGKSREEVEKEEEARLMRSMLKKKNSQTNPFGGGKNIKKDRIPQEEKKPNTAAPPVKQARPTLRTHMDPGKVKKGVMTVRMKNTAQLAQIKEHNTYTSWVNWVMKSKGKSISNLTQDLVDGVLLCHLASTLLKKEVKVIPSPKLPFHRYENINTAIGAFREKIPNLYVPNAKIFEEENLLAVLALFYRIVSTFTSQWSKEKDTKSEDEKGVKESAFKWAEEITRGYDKCKDLHPAKNGTDDFKNGEIIKAIVHAACRGTPEEFQLSDLDHMSVKDSTDFVLNKAEKGLGIPKFFSGEDLVDHSTPIDRQLMPWLLAMKAQAFQKKQSPTQREESFPALPSLPTGDVPSFGDVPQLPEEEVPSFGDVPQLPEESPEELPAPPAEEEEILEEPPAEMKEGVNVADEFSTSGSGLGAAREASEKEKKQTCTKCAQYLSGLIVVVHDQLFHERCFVCTTCQATFEKYYWTWEGRPLCFPHYQDAAGLVCKKCSQKIADSTVVNALGGKWHADCFSCKQCSKPLGDKFYLFEDHTYCDLHYFSVAGEVCAACSEPIRDQVIIEALKKKWHPICFCCTDCHVCFIPEDKNAPTKSFYNNDGKPYCPDCDNKFHGIKSGEVCAKCQKPVTKNILEAMKKIWHEDCFVCAHCNKEFDASYVNVSGLPYHKECCEKI